MSSSLVEDPEIECKAMKHFVVTSLRSVKKIKILIARFPIRSGMTILGGLLLTSCSAVLPDKDRDLSEFIPQEKIVEQIICSTNCNFAQENYPQNCRWAELSRIIDGDTIVVDEDAKVRFIGIDTPEDKDPRKPLQPFALEAADALRDILKDSSKVCLISDSVGDQIDKYGRTLAYVFSEEGVDANAELLKRGFAKGYYYFPFERKEEFHVYEAQAKEAKVGRWEKGLLIFNFQKEKFKLGKSRSEGITPAFWKGKFQNNCLEIAFYIEHFFTTCTASHPQSYLKIPFTTVRTSNVIDTITIGGFTIVQYSRGGIIISCSSKNFIAFCNAIFLGVFCYIPRLNTSVGSSFSSESETSSRLEER
ncbi:thermonuclease family protein [Candidatus Gracilibacteria bacterium]|nr:thermonuclease family protein [Candidatus Gracilibacteria bacterium]